MDRIEHLRRDAINPVVTYEAFFRLFFLKYRDNAGLGTLQARYADAMAYAFDRVPVVIGDGELIVGRMEPLQGAYAEEWKALQKTVVPEIETYDGQDSHMAVDYPLLLSEGIEGILARIPETGGDQDFYGACRVCLKSVARFSQRYSDAARAMAENCGDADRKAELLKLSEICARVPLHPAQTFHEALQSVHFISFCLSVNPFRPNANQQFQLGHPDRFLLPYYQADEQLTDDEAQLLLDCLGIQINRRVCRGLSSGYMVGGRDRDGKIVDNPLTRMCMQVVDDIRLVYPSVGLCCCKDTPEETLAAACEILSHGRSHPAIFNDDIITQGLRLYGVPEDESHEYIHSTCVEITPVGASNVWVASPYTNMAQLLLDCMDREYDSFEALMTALYARLDDSIRRNFEQQNAFRAMRSEKTVNPLLSCFVSDCLERGVDIERGGARYNWIMPSFVGMANLVDSLHVLRSFIFEQKAMTLRDLKAKLDNNFEGEEPLRLRLENAYAKYGNNQDEVDLLFCGIMDHIVAECRKYKPLLPNARLIPSVFCWVMHEHFGSLTGATPDGRRAGFPLGDGSGACQGREKHGPTASVLSSTKWSHKELIGGVAVNMKFPKKTFTAQSCANVRALIRTYLERGGFEIQMNVVDRETLLKAQAHPEDYRDLVVRIGGYSDYFVNLSPAMQAEVLLRTAHEV